MRNPVENPPLLAKSARSGAPIFIGWVRPSDDRDSGQMSRSILAQVEDSFRVQMEDSLIHEEQ
jgi:hypothetical protein